MKLHILDIFFDEPVHIGFYHHILEFFQRKPFKSGKSLFFSGFWILNSAIFYEKEIDIFIDDGISFFMGSHKAVVDLGHKFYDF